MAITRVSCLLSGSAPSIESNADYGHEGRNAEPNSKQNCVDYTLPRLETASGGAICGGLRPYTAEQILFTDTWAARDTGERVRNVREDVSKAIT